MSHRLVLRFAPIAKNVPAVGEVLQCQNKIFIPTDDVINYYATFYTLSLWQICKFSFERKLSYVTYTLAQVFCFVILFELTSVSYGIYESLLAQVTFRKKLSDVA